MNQAYQEIVQTCITYALQKEWTVYREGAHLGLYLWKHEPWWVEMKQFILNIDVTCYPISSWDWVDQCDIGIDYFNEHLLRHKCPYSIFKKYILYRLANERIRPLICT
jgi:hypothetical protein